MAYLTLPHGLLGMDNRIQGYMTVLIVRLCFRAFYDAIMQPWEGIFGGGPVTKIPIIYVLGTPGVGKTIFRNYVTRRLLHQARDVGKSLVIVFDKASQSKPIHDFIVVCQSANGDLTAASYSHTKLADVQELVKQHETIGDVVISLVDVSEGAPPRVLAKYNMQFASPNQQITMNKDRTKEGSALDFWMPMWKLSEISAAHPVIFAGKSPDKGDKFMCVKDTNAPTLELSLRRVAKFGATARAAFSPHVQDYFTNLKRVLDSQEWSFVNLMGRLDEERVSLISMASHTLLHADVPDAAVSRGIFAQTADGDDVVVPILQWASVDVRSQAAAAAMRQLDQDVEATLHGDSPSGVKGELIEALWFERMVVAASSDSESRQSGFALTVSLKQENKSQAESQASTYTAVNDMLRVGNLKTRWEFADAIAKVLPSIAVNVYESESILLRPFEHTMGAVDGVIIAKYGEDVWCIFLQVTIAASHPTKGQASACFLETLVTAANDAGCKSVIVFVIPPKRFCASRGEKKKKEFCWIYQEINKELAPKAAALVQLALCPSARAFGDK